ncbi:MAG TPA: hypothetical protein VNF91_10770, partial [Candidatus Acidoferrum sp.]|nr:hypothetical protein [Candidatus Acidoferrum sp.]
RLARLIADIEPKFRDDVILVLASRFDLEETKLGWDTAVYCGTKFKVMRVRSKREAMGHPDGSFAVWAGTLDALAEGWASGSLQAQSALMLEADGVPLRADWIDILVAEHKRTLESGKRITGPEMNEGTPHLNGSMFVHLSAWLDRPSLHRCPPGQAWDLFHADVLMTEGRGTGRMRNVYGASRWSADALRNMARECAWLASSKDDSALEWAERTLPRRVRRTPESPRHYATVCHERQVPVLHRSMIRHCMPFVLHVLCWDWEPQIAEGREETPQGELHWAIKYTRRDAFLERHPSVMPLPGPARNANETVCTIRWRFFCDVMEDTGQPLTAIDGDMMFFGDPEPLFNEIGDAPCAVSPHNFAPDSEGLPGVTLESHAKFSTKNGGWSYFADRTALERMRKLTDEWCKIGWRRMPNGRLLFGDQGYLELLEEEHGAHVIRHPGVNLGPWSRYIRKLSTRDGQILVDGQPLISAHFQSLKFDGERITQLADASYEITDDIVHVLYDPYVKEVAGCNSKI